MALFTIIAVSVTFAVRFRTDRQRLTDYLIAASGVVDAYEGVASDIDNLVVGLETTERPVLVDRLDSAAELVSAAHEQILAADPPPKAGVASGYAIVASEAWSRGVVGLRDGIVTLLDDPGSITGRRSLADAITDLRLGDRAHRGFLEAVAALENESVTRVTTEVEFVTAEMAPLFDADRLAERIEDLRGLGARHDLAVAALRFDPEPAGDREGVPVVPFSESLGVQVTVTNRGNEPEADFEVGLTLLERDVADPVFTETRTIEQLAPGESTVLEFMALPVTAGRFHEVVVTVALAGDADPDSNTLRQVFFRNEES